MKKQIWWVIAIIGAAIFLISQMEMVRYKYVPMPTGGGVYKVDRFTGDTYLVTPSGIRKVRER